MKYLFFALLILSSCGKNIEERLKDPANDPLFYKGDYSGVFMIYEDELKTGGGMMFYASPDNQELDFFYSDDGNKVIRYYWNGGEVFDYNSESYQHNWCGFGLIVGHSWEEAEEVSMDFSGIGYSKLKFKVKGYLSQNTVLKIEGPKKAGSSEVADYIELDSSDISYSWKEFSLPISSSSLKDFNIYVGIIFEATEKGSGGEVFIDSLRFER
ncbi:MAG: hypothetical protein DRI36_00040 [Caldiserica bacterium]|nr:MAG: hypothetical protein DRI36_00040 [Caldisericota bacterium]